MDTVTRFARPKAIAQAVYSASRGVWHAAVGRRLDPGQLFDAAFSLTMAGARRRDLRSAVER